MLNFYLIIIVLGLAAGSFLMIRWLMGFVKPDIVTNRISRLIALKNYSEALDTGLKLIKEKASSYSLLQNIAKAYEGLYQYRHAIEFYEKSIVLLKRESQLSLRHDIYNKLAELYMIIREPDSALGYYNLILRENRNNMKALFFSAKLLHFQKQLQKSRERLEIYIKARPNEIVPLLLLANVYYEQGEYPKSLGILDVIGRQTDEMASLRDEEILFLQAKNQVGLKNFSKALPYLKNLLDRGSMTGEALPLYIIALVRDKKINAAMILYSDNQSVLGSRKMDVMYEIAEAYFDEGDIYKALDTWKKVSEENPNFLDIKNIMSRYKVLFENVALAKYFTADENEFQEYVLKKFQAPMNAVIERGRDYWIIKSGKEAVVLYRKAGQISPDAMK